MDDNKRKAMLDRAKSFHKQYELERSVSNIATKARIIDGKVRNTAAKLSDKLDKGVDGAVRLNSKLSDKLDKGVEGAVRLNSKLSDKLDKGVEKGKGRMKRLIKGVSETIRVK